jgi:predicted RNase H-like HicB family nuclease
MVPAILYVFAFEGVSKNDSKMRRTREFAAGRRKLRLAGYGRSETDKMKRVQDTGGESCMRTYTAVIERCPETGLYVGYVPGLPGAHSQGETIEELNANLAEVIEMLLEDGEPAMESEFIGTQTVQVG